MEAKNTQFNPFTAYIFIVLGILHLIHFFLEDERTTFVYIRTGFGVILIVFSVIQLLKKRNF